MAGQPERVCARNIEKYAEQIRKPGSWLEIVDAELFVRNAGGHLVVGVEHSADSPLTMLSSADQFSHLFTEGRGLEHPAFNITDNNVWVLISCNASYDPHGPKNHWVPGFLRQHVTDDDWFDLSVLSLSQSVQDYREKKAQLGLLKEQANTSGLISNELGQQIMQTRVSDLEEEVARSLGLVGLWFDVVLQCFTWFYMFYYVLLSFFHMLIIF